MSRHRVRWPLIALVALVAALAIGYLVREAGEHHRAGTHHGSLAPIGSMRR